MVALLVAVVVALTPVNALALFGADAAIMAPILIKQLIEAYKQLTELQNLLNQGKASFEYLKLVNAGADNIVGLLGTLPIKDENLLAEIRSLQIGLRKMDALYGKVPKSSDADAQALHDQTVVESFEMTNAAKEYAANQEQNASKAFAMSTEASPKGAARLSAATNAQLLHTMVQLLKVNGQLLKLQGESLAIQNKKDKDATEHFNQANANIGSKFSSYSGDLGIPRF